MMPRTLSGDSGRVALHVVHAGRAMGTHRRGEGQGAMTSDRALCLSLQILARCTAASHGPAQGPVAGGAWQDRADTWGVTGGFGRWG